MAMTNSQIEHKLRQHDNDIASIYEILTEIKTTVTSHDARFDTIDGRFEAIDGRLNAVDARFEAVDARFDTIDGRLDTIDGALAEVLRRLPEQP